MQGALDTAPATSLTGKRWVWPPLAIGPELTARDASGLPRWVPLFLARRGIDGEEARRRFLTPSLALVDDPGTMADMPAALEVIVGALRERRRMVVYGDYDVDGVCSTALLVELLQALGGDVGYYIPDRRAEGYGLNEAAVREICGRAAVLITTDCGITAQREVAVARALGAEVIVVDHHRVPAELPPANACLDPHRGDCAFPAKVLCATGVAFMLAVALRRALRETGFFAARPEPDLRALLDLVAVATVADMVPLTGLNRILVATGLRRVAATERPGLRALLEVAGVHGAVTSADLGFRVGPRINARGRLAHAAEAVELLLTADAERARLLAGALDAANRERREIERATVSAAVAVIEQEGHLDDPALVLYDSSWHPGVLGLVASRLTAAYHRPAVVIGEGGKGSGRSVPGVDLHAAISRAGEHLVRFGGHRAAAGVTIEPEAVPAFREALGAVVRVQLGAPPYVPVVAPDLELRETVLSLDFVSALDALAPFGQENPEPLCVTSGLAVRSARVVGGEHLKLVLGDAGLEAIGFGMAALAGRLPPRLDVAFRPQRDSYGGHERLVLRLEDVRAAGRPAS